MRLTKYIRDAFVTAAMADVPKINYSEQARKLCLDHFAEEFKKAFGEPYTEAKFGGWIGARHVRMPHNLQDFWAVAPAGFDHGSGPLKGPLLEMSRAKKVQSDGRDALQDKLRGVANSCTTRKQLTELLPEFEKYLPEEGKATPNLPMVTDVADAFKAAGWGRK